MEARVRIETPKTVVTLIVYNIFSNPLAAVERVGSKKTVITTTTKSCPYDFMETRLFSLRLK